MTVNQGICRKGPLDRQVKTIQGHSTFVPPGELSGMYVFVPARGPTAAEWRWVEKGKEPK